MGLYEIRRLVLYVLVKSVMILIPVEMRLLEDYMKIFISKKRSKVENALMRMSTKRRIAQTTLSVRIDELVRKKDYE